MSDIIWTPNIQIRSKSVILYETPDVPPLIKRHAFKPYQTYSGTVTDSAAKRIRRTVDVFLQMTPKRVIYNPVTDKKQPFRLGFTTLTIAQNERISGKEGHEALKIFLQHFRRPWRKKQLSESIKSYIWKAEVQERGQLHYHITTNSFMHFAEVNRVWNDIQRRRGWLNSFHARYGHWNPNGTDVHAVYKINDIQAYLSKYLAKAAFIDVSEYGFPAAFRIHRNIGAKVWDASNDLKKPRFSGVMDFETDARLRDVIRATNVEVRRLERCTVVEVPNGQNLLSQTLKNEYIKWKK